MIESKMLHIYNTLGRELQEFKPINPQTITMYQCGPTVYWTQHIGNLRAAVMGDLVHRSLMYLGYNVNFTRNYTDVGHLTDDGDAGEDKMEKGARREGKTPQEIAQTYIDQFESDINALNIILPTNSTRATDYVQHMIELTQELLQKGFAYTTPKAVYFDVTKAKDYTRLSGQKLEFNKEGSGHGDVQDPQKRNQADFALWFFKAGKHANAIQNWPSPFVSTEVEEGLGFPGWHIECSAMARATLGESIDLHLGGVEHIPVHHTNEIAQSESATGKPFSNYWLHYEHLMVDGGKMSKSEGNVYNLSDVVAKGYNPLALRYFFLQAHYRSKQNFTWEALAASATAYSRLLAKLSEFYAKLPAGEQVLEEAEDATYKQKFANALQDDFNIPQALATAWELLKDEALSELVRLRTMLSFDQVLGLKIESSLTNPDTAATQTQSEIPAEAKTLIAQRQTARDNKDWDLADKLRDRLKQEYDLEVLDTKEGQEIKG